MPGSIGYGKEMDYNHRTKTFHSRFILDITRHVGKISCLSWRYHKHDGIMARPQSQGKAPWGRGCEKFRQKQNK